MARTALLMLFLSIYLTYAVVSASNEERELRSLFHPSSKKCMEYSERCTRYQKFCVPFFKHHDCSKWVDRCNRFNQLCPRIVSQQVVVPQQVVVAQPQQVVPQQVVVAQPQQVVPQQVVVAQPQQVMVQPAQQIFVQQQKPQKIKFKLFG